jgi:hypothetical protein
VCVCVCMFARVCVRIISRDASSPNAAEGAGRLTTVRVNVIMIAAASGPLQTQGFQAVDRSTALTEAPTLSF